MTGFEKLLACAGTWDGRNHVQTAVGEPINDSPSQLIVTPLLRDTFVRIDQTWSWKDEPQSGSMLISYDPKTEVANMHWIDTWHNGRRVMPLVGKFDEKGVLIVNGHFSVADGLDWGWRIDLRMNDDRLKIEMFCIKPSGKHDGGVWAEFSRA